MEEQLQGSPTRRVRLVLASNELYANNHSKTYLLRRICPDEHISKVSCGPVCNGDYVIGQITSYRRASGKLRLELKLCVSFSFLCERAHRCE